MNNKAWLAAFEVIATLQRAGFEAYIVGGAVRDQLLGKDVHDVDVATSALPTEVQSLFTTTVDVGILHGTVIVVHPLAPIEVTTFRVEGTYEDHRRPSTVHFVRNLRDDLARRDFTVNAMALTKDHTIIDYFGGQADLAAKIVRAVGDAKERFSEDALRMLRAVRFVAQLNFTVDRQTKDAIQSCSADLAYVARERIKQEIDKIWQGEAITEAIRLMEATDLVKVLPGVWRAQTWRGFKPKTVEEGWAYFLHYNRTQPHIASHYRLTNQEKRSVKQIHLAFDALVERGFTRLDYYRYDGNVLCSAVRIARHLQRTKLSEEDVLQNKARLPIQSRQALAVDGHDLQKWCNKKPGKWLQQALQEIERAVLYEEIDNTQQQIRSWYCNGVDQR